MGFNPEERGSREREREERQRKRGETEKERESPAHLYIECLFGSELKKCVLKHVCLLELNPTFYVAYMCVFPD